MSDLLKRLQATVSREVIAYGSTSHEYEIAEKQVQEAIYRIRELEAEVERLRAGGCARDQRLTQYCAEAVAAEAKAKQAKDAADEYQFAAETENVIRIEAEAKLRAVAELPRHSADDVRGDQEVVFVSDLDAIVRGGNENE